MKQINNYLNEALINKNTKMLSMVDFKSDVDNKYPNEIKGRNFVFNSQDWPNGYFIISMNCIKKVLEFGSNFSGLDRDDLEFIEKIYDEFKTLKKRDWGTYKEKTDLINGEAPKFNRAKFFYDMFNWILKEHKKTLTIPQTQKINKILKDKDLDFKWRNFYDPNSKEVTYNIKGLSWPK